MINPGDVYKFRYSPKKEWGFDGRTWCFEGFLVADSDCTLIDTYWGIGNSSGRVMSAADIEREVVAGGRFEFYFNLNDVDRISNYEDVYYANEDLFHVSEQHACLPGCRHTFKKRHAKRNRDKMLDVLREQSRLAKRDSELAIQRHARLEGDIHLLLAGDLSIHIDGGAR